MRQIEFWPDYGGALLHEEGKRISLDSLELPQDLIGELGRWLGQYDDAKLEPATRDQAWIVEGQRLFARLREEVLGAEIDLVDWEGSWNTTGV